MKHDGAISNIFTYFIIVLIVSTNYIYIYIYIYVCVCVCVCVCVYLLDNKVLFCYNCSGILKAWCINVPIY